MRDVNAQLLIPDTHVLFPHILSQFIQYSLQVFDRQRSVDYRGAPAHDLIEDVGEITGS